MRTFDEIKNTVETGLGQHVCDTKLENVKLVNVFSGEIYKTDIYIKGRRIISTDPDADLKSKEVIDCGGKYALPGFIDCHMHFESTMLSPEALASIVVPNGTTTLCADMMEIANVAGEAGMRAMLTSIASLPLRMLIEVPSRVPTAPGLETTGAVLGIQEVRNILGWEQSISLGELDPSKILFVQDEYLHKIADTLKSRRIVNGHAIGRLGQELNVYASSGISDDHECVTKEEMTARLRAGMCVLIREGSTERNLDTLIRGALETSCPCENLAFCTDDKHPGDILREGHINYNVRKAVSLGFDPVKAIQLATINAARHFRLEDEIGSITPGRNADILIMDDLKTMNPAMVFFEGSIVAQNGSLTSPCRFGVYPGWLLDTVHLKKPVTSSSYSIKAKTNKKTARVKVISLVDRQIINHSAEAELPVNNGFIDIDEKNDILKLSVTERYGKTGGIGIAFVHGFGLKNGALAYSMSHDHHNIVSVGTNDDDMADAVNEVVRLHGGLSVACDGKIAQSMSLPIGGLMSPLDAGTVMAQIDSMNSAARSIGCVLPSPFMTLSFISLPTVPELGLTDKGLVDVLSHRLIDVEINA